MLSSSKVTLHFVANQMGHSSATRQMEHMNGTFSVYKFIIVGLCFQKNFFSISNLYTYDSHKILVTIERYIIEFL